MAMFGSEDWMRETAEETMRDRVVVLAYSGDTKTSYGRPKPRYTPGRTTHAGVRFVSGKQVNNGTEMVLVDAVIRLPLGTAVSGDSRISITSIKGRKLDTPKLMEVIGQIADGETCIVVNAKEVVSTNA